jgi:glutaminyl-tRNA synthetase
MSTIAGYRRRGYTPEAIWALAEETGATKFNSIIDVARLENAIREDLNKRAQRRMAVLRPLKVVIENWPAGKVDMLDAQNNPEDPGAGARQVPFSGTLYIEREDFMEDAPKKFFRLAPGREVRLRWAYFVTCTGVVKNDAGEVTELRCSYDPATRGGDAPDGRKVKGTLHWVSARHCAEAEVRLYDRLFTAEFPGKDSDFLDQINPASLETLSGCKVERSLTEAAPEDRFQFERQGFFCADRFDHAPGRAVFNRTVTLRDSWAKVAG